MPDYEYACQKLHGGIWIVVGSGPGSLSSARSDFHAWSIDGYTVRIVRRELTDWQVTDQTFTRAHKPSSSTGQEDSP